MSGGAAVRACERDSVPGDRKNTAASTPRPAYCIRFGNLAIMFVNSLINAGAIPAPLYSLHMAELVTLEDIRSARERIAGVAVRTGLYEVDAARLKAAGAGELPFSLFVKAESEQPIGSFKLRGAYNCIAQLSKEELQRGVITYSSGNHAQGVAYAARALGAKAVIVMPEAAPMIKREATLAMGAEIVLVGPASSERLAKAQELSAKHGYKIIPPYDDRAIIAGQGTC